MVVIVLLGDIALLAGWITRGQAVGQAGRLVGMTNQPLATVTPIRTVKPTYAELEASLEAHFYKQVRLLGGRVEKLAPTRKGIPDRLVLLPGGRIYLCELKATSGRVSAAQSLWHERAAELGTRVQLLIGRAGVDAWIREKGEEIDSLPKPKRTTRK